MIDQFIPMLKSCILSKLDKDYSQYAQASGAVLSMLSSIDDEDTFNKVHKILIDISLGKYTSVDDFDSSYEIDDTKPRRLTIIKEPIKEFVKDRKTKLLKLEEIKTLEAGQLTYLKLVEIDEAWCLLATCIGTKIKGLTSLSYNDLIEVLRIVQKLYFIKYIKLDEKTYESAFKQLTEQL